MILFEEENARVYILLLRVEIALRECLKASYEKKFGKQWAKNLPGDLLQKIKSSQKEENRPQFNFIRLGPLYYLTFGELLTVLRQKHGSEVVEMIGGEGVLKQIENVCVLRNAVCHSRPVSSVGLRTIEGLYAQFETALSSEKVEHFLSNPDAGVSRECVAQELLLSLRNALEALPKIPREIKVADVYKKAIAQFWWANDELAGFDRAVVENAFSMLLQYNQLPVGVGTAAERQAFVSKCEADKLISNAIRQLTKVEI